MASGILPGSTSSFLPAEVASISAKNVTANKELDYFNDKLLTIENHINTPVEHYPPLDGYYHILFALGYIKNDIQVYLSQVLGDPDIDDYIKEKATSINEKANTLLNNFTSHGRPINSHWTAIQTANKASLLFKRIQNELSECPINELDKEGPVKSFRAVIILGLRTHIAEIEMGLKDLQNDVDAHTNIGLNCWDLDLKDSYVRMTLEALDVARLVILRLLELPVNEEFKELRENANEYLELTKKLISSLNLTPSGAEVPDVGDDRSERSETISVKSVKSF